MHFYYITTMETGVRTLYLSTSDVGIVPDFGCEFEVDSYRLTVKINDDLSRSFCISSVILYFVIQLFLLSLMLRRLLLWLKCQFIVNVGIFSSNIVNLFSIIFVVIRKLI